MQTFTTPQAAADWLRARLRGSQRLSVDSRQVGAGDGFIAWPGAAVDGRQFVAQALAQGAQACLVEADGVDAVLPPELRNDSRVAAYAGLKAATALVAAQFFDHPSRSLHTVAITGTNGKTSTAWWLANLWPSLPPDHAQRCLMVGTLGVGEPPNVQSTGLTTPDPVRLHGAFAQALQAGVTACVMEASSIGLEEHRLDGVRVDTAVFTNFTQDHLDYHPSMAAYWQAKRKLFEWPGLRHAVVNIDDPKGMELAQALQQRPGLDVWTVGLHPEARLRAAQVQYLEDGMGIELIESEMLRASMHTHQFGDFNVSNLLGVVASLRAWGVPLDAVAAAAAMLPAVPGRLQRVPAEAGPLVLVDYAHTHDALDKALRAVQPLAQQRGGQIWCVFGCGGNRDARKRPLMGEVAEREAHHVVVTSDNPRDELPETIVADIEAGMRLPHWRELDRAAAIALAVKHADARDVVVLAGKGHEDYQEVKGQRHHFSDVEVAHEALQARARGEL